MPSAEALAIVERVRENHRELGKVFTERHKLLILRTQESIENNKKGNNRSKKEMKKEVKDVGLGGSQESNFKKVMVVD